MKVLRTTLILMALLSVVCVSVGLASGDGHAEDSPWTTSKLLWRVINSIALVVLLVYFLKKPLVSFFSERTEQISKDLDSAREQRESAEKLIKEYELKIAGMAQELERMRSELASLAEAERQKVVVNADQMATKMVESAKVTAEQEVRKARIALKNEAVELAVQMAEAMIREKITEDDRRTIVEDYLAKVGGMK
jgi:F-type H+-transporting ATPase subunit b